MIKLHVAAHYQLASLVRTGISLIVDNKPENFNVVCFMVADLCFIKDVIGQCQCTSLFGCYHCMMKSSEWTNMHRSTAKPKKISVMKEYGLKALKVLGENPKRDSAIFTNCQQSHAGNGYCQNSCLSNFQ